LKSGQLADFRAALLVWFREFQRDLPWRRSRHPYRIWISEIMLQQTRVAAVIPYYRRFLERFPDVRALAEAPEEEVLRLWSGLGYYSRARNLQRAARQIVARHGGEFPRTPAEVLQLAGIGRYTAAAVLSMAFGEPCAVLDGNVARVLARLDAVRGDLRQPERWRELETRADELLARQVPGDWNQAMMELGATLCTPRAPQCLLCPVSGFCKARQLGIAEELPDKRKKRAAARVELAVAVLLDAHRNSLLLPPPTAAPKSKADDHVPSLVAKLWHFPTVSAASNAEDTLKEFLAASLPETNARMLRFEALGKVRHTVTYRRITVIPFVVRTEAVPRIAGAKQVALDEIPALPISNLTRKVARAAINHETAGQQ
jgi:A/G-specific adenine glycosylase